jgi:peroxiredoxin
LAAVVSAAECGKPAPDFTATDINGKTVKLSDYKGKIVILESYNSDCPFDANHYSTGAMQELQKDATSKGVVWLLVNSVSPNNPSHLTAAAAKKEMAAKKISATAWIDDSSGALATAYDIRTTPNMFVIDTKGILAYQGAIDDTADPIHDPRKAKNYVRQALAELATGKTVSVTETKSYGCAVKF